MWLKKHVHFILPLLCFLAALLLLGQSGYIMAKANVSQWLIDKAWVQLKQDHQPKQAKPWPWADTWPVAQLRVRGERLYVLNSVSGESLSFGPGHYSKTALPGSAGDSVIAAHRDTHFKVLKELKKGDRIQAENYLGEQQRYRVQQINIVDSRQQQIHIDPSQNRLQLITCYPFDAVAAGGPLRYVVVADAIP